MSSPAFVASVRRGMASGLGIVAYRYAAARQHLEHGHSALLAPFDDRAAFVAQAERLVREFEAALREVAHVGAAHVAA